MASSETALSARMQALQEAAELSQGRSPDDVVTQASDIVRRAGERIRISGDHTVVALAGATGSGKSSTFNALSGTQLAATGVTRPTTSEAMAVVWGTELPTPLLDWLDVSRRHLVASKTGPFTNLVLLDLPDHDSTERHHQVTVDRLVKLVDMLIWIVDPQKYADAAIHDQYLKPLADHSEVMVVVLNQADRLSSVQLQQAMADLRKLLDSEGLAETPVMAMSALTGDGVNEVRHLLERVVAEKSMTAKRYSADVSGIAEDLAQTLGSERIPAISPAVEDKLNAATAVSAGVPIVTNAVRDAWRYRGTLATGWPVLKWLARFKPDPLKKLRIGLPTLQLTSGESPVADGTVRTSLPKASPVARAQLDAALRDLTDSTTAGLPRGWAEAVRDAARGNERVLADRLDVSIAGADLRLGKGHGWWGLVNVLQWLLFLAALAGLAWLFLPLLFTFLQFPPLPHVYWWGFPAPTLLLIFGVAGGLLLSLLSRGLVELGARMKANRAREILTERIAEVTHTDVIVPVRQELERLASARAAVARAR